MESDPLALLGEGVTAASSSVLSLLLCLRSRPFSGQHPRTTSPTTSMYGENLSRSGRLEALCRFSLSSSHDFFCDCASGFGSRRSFWTSKKATAFLWLRMTRGLRLLPLDRYPSRLLCLKTELSSLLEVSSADHPSFSSLVVPLYFASAPFRLWLKQVSGRGAATVIAPFWLTR